MSVLKLYSSLQFLGRIQYYAKVTFLFLSVRTGYIDFINNICIVTLQFTQSSAQIITLEAIKL